MAEHGQGLSYNQPSLVFPIFVSPVPILTAIEGLLHPGRGVPWGQEVGCSFWEVANTWVFGGFRAIFSPACSGIEAPHALGSELSP